MSATLSPLGTAALDYAVKGFAVFPVTAGQKKPPLTEHGLLDATTDEKQIRQWWTRWPAANIAINCKMSRLVVVDVDIPGHEHKQDGRPTLAALEAELGKLPPTVEAVTGAGGKHLIFAAPAGVEFRGSLGPGLDLKSNGYIVVAPSTTEGPYRWVTPL